MALVFFAGLILLGYASAAAAAPGDLDASFGSFGKVTTNFGVQDIAGGVAVQDDDKVVVAGWSFDGSTNDIDFAVSRYNADGTPDATFGGGDGKVTTDFSGGSSDFGQDVAVRADGKIVVAGYTIDSAQDQVFAVARYNTDGSPDNTFGGDGKVTTALGTEFDLAYGVAVRGNKTVVVGESYQGTPPNGTRDFGVVRYTQGGDPDSTFGGGDGIVTTDFSDADDVAYSVAIQPDGKIVAGGHAATGTANQDDFALVRYDSAGNPDNSFDTDGKVTTNIRGDEQAFDVALQEDGRIVAAGYTRADAASPLDFALARYNTNGSLNTSFGAGGKVTTDFGGNERASGVIVQDDGKIVAAGDASGDFVLARYDADGSPNEPFGNDGKVSTDFSGFPEGAVDLALQTEGRVVAAGTVFYGNATNFSDFAAARYFVGDDATPPKVSAPVQSLNIPSTLGSVSVPVKISWSATDAEGDVTNYQLQLSTDGKPYKNVALPNPTATTVTRLLQPDHDYRFRVRATDDNGNSSFFKYGPRFTVDALQENDASVTYDPVSAWTRAPLSRAYGGQVAFTRTDGASATLDFTGTNVAWVAPKRTVSGKADIFLDDRKVATVDLRSTVGSPRRVVYAANGLSPTANHTLRVEVVGTSRVDVDAFVVLR